MVWLFRWQRILLSPWGTKLIRQSGTYQSEIFLTAFAVVDDIGGILVIALFYSSHLDVNFLLYSFGVLFCFVPVIICIYTIVGFIFYWDW